MTEVRNRSRLAESAYRLVREAIIGLTHVDEFYAASSIIPNLVIVRAVAYDDGTHDIIVSGSSVQVSFASTCEGELLSATLWDRHPSNDELILDRLEGLNPASTSIQRNSSCYIGGHLDRAEAN